MCGALLYGLSCAFSSFQHQVMFPDDLTPSSWHSVGSGFSPDQIPVSGL